MGGGVRSSRVGKGGQQADATNASGTKPIGSNSATQGENGDGNVDDESEVLENGISELSHLVDPITGTYSTKVTIPKNFSGLLYISGLNLSSLTDKILYVRFRFGRELSAVTIQATIGRAPGITPQSDIEVLILDIRDKPFSNVRLLYDLFDYNDYRDDSGVEFGSSLASGKTISLVTDPRDKNLYCRGLDTKYDSSFIPTLSRPSCNYAGGICKYTYAKIKDSGLYSSTGVAIIPSEPQIALGSSGYVNDSKANALKKCLPDSPTRDVLKNVLGLTVDSAFSGSGFGFNITFSDATTYNYRGPYRGLSVESWQISSSALFSRVTSTTEPSGLFQYSYNNVTGNLYKDYMGYESFLFPRVGKMNLVAGVEHFSSATPFADTTRTSLGISGDTDYMDGCNIRVSNYDENTNEGISSCNVVAKIELLTIDPVSGSETIITSDTSLKLQLIRESNVDYEGNEVLYSSMKRCSGSNACGSNECCYNERCWSKTLVSSCLEDVASVGNGQTGDICTSDYECSSFCCNASIGRCAVHIDNEEQSVLCSKSPGQTCVTRSLCQKEYIKTCYIVKTGFDQVGAQECGVRCYFVPTNADCINGICTSPATPTMPSFDQNDPDRCDNAIDPPTNF